MIELLVTCLLAGGMTFAPPPGWTVESIYSGGGPGLTLNYCGSSPCESPRSHVKLRRTIEAGQRVEVPSGCTVEAKR